MQSLNKLWLLLAIAVVLVATIACSFGKIFPTGTTTEPSPSMAGYWIDPDTDNVFTIEWQNTGGGYVVTSGSAGLEIGELTITDQSWSKGLLTWTYSVQCTDWWVKITTYSVSADKLSINWLVSDGSSGTQDLLRVTSPISPQASNRHCVAP